MSGPGSGRGAREYQRELARAFGVPEDGPPPRFDLVLLGMGADGHTASLFPRTPVLREPLRWVVPNRAPVDPRDRLIFTLPLIDRDRCVLFLVVGADKAAVLARCWRAPGRAPDRAAPLATAPLRSHVSYERVLSGPGLLNVYGFLREASEAPEASWLAGELRSGDPSAVRPAHRQRPLCPPDLLSPWTG